MKWIPDTMPLSFVIIVHNGTKIKQHLSIMVCGGCIKKTRRGARGVIVHHDYTWRCTARD